MSWLIALITLMMTHISRRCLARTGFVKDVNEDLVDFPPRIVEMVNSPVPLGHLRPLGWQSNPVGQIEERWNLPDPDQFYQEFVRSGKPVVFRNSTSNAPAIKNWNNTNYLRDKYGDIDVHVTVKKEMFSSGPKKMKFSKFLKEFRYEDWYLSNFVPVEMMHELVLPKPLVCGFREWLMESELWMSSGGTSSLLHSHADHDLHCLLSGRKDFIFIEWKYRQYFDFKDKSPYRGAGYSKFDPDRINMFKFSPTAQVPWTWTTLRAGDCVFVPAGYLHQVRSYGLSISSTNHFSPSPEISITECRDVILMSPFHTLLNEAQFLWTYSNGYMLLTAFPLTAASMRHHLLMIIRDAEALIFDMFEDFYNEVTQNVTNQPSSKTVWSYLDTSDTNSISRDLIKDTLSTEALGKVAIIFNSAQRELRKKFSRKKRDEL